MNTAKIAEYLKQNNNYHIIVHKNPDGDCLGSAKALCLCLRQMGKNAKIILPGEVSNRLSFMWDKSLCEGDFHGETVIAVDVASFGQMGDLYETVFKNSRNTICIDHHGTNTGYAEINLIDAQSAATGEIIFDIISCMNAQITDQIAESLLISIADDTGSFQYSNTTSRTHKIISELYKVISNAEPIMRRLYGTHSQGEIAALKIIIPTVQYHLGGKVCTMCADIKEIESAGAESSNVDAWVGLPRSVMGVEVGMMIKILGENEVKVSLRSNDYVDVAALAALFGGGGHKRAAGVTFFESAESAKEKILKELEKLV